MLTSFCHRVDFGENLWKCLWWDNELKNLSHRFPSLKVFIALYIATYLTSSAYYRVNLNHIHSYSRCYYSFDKQFSMATSWCGLYLPQYTCIVLCSYHSHFNHSKCISKLRKRNHNDNKMRKWRGIYYQESDNRGTWIINEWEKSALSKKKNRSSVYWLRIWWCVPIQTNSWSSWGDRR